MTIEAKEPIRLKTRELLTKVFTNDNQIHYNEIELSKTMVNLEKGIFNNSIQYAKENDVIYEWSNFYFVTIYKNKVRSIYVNLKENPLLVQSILSKKILAHELAFMKHTEMKPELWVTIIQAWEFIKKQELECNDVSMTDQFTCGKCHINKTRYYQMQIRSADEPMTVFISCLVCGNKWTC